MTLLQSGLAKSLAEDYTIENSIRFDHATNPYLTSPTLGTATSNQKGTLSFWVKYCKLDTNQVMFSGTSAGSNLTYFGPRADNMMDVYDQDGGYEIFVTRTVEVFRDVGAWYHIIWAADTTQTTEADRVHMYVNGTEVTYNGSGSYPGLNDVIQMFDTGGVQYIGRRSDVTSQCFGGYYAEFHYVDGQQLTPSDFGETDSTTNQWKPIEYEGTYGTNGFYQKYAGTELANSFEDSAEKTIDAFTTTGSHTWTCPTGITSAEILVVAGGGGGAGSDSGLESAGGGGAGGVVHHATYTTVPGVVYDITVGTGGVKGFPNQSGSSNHPDKRDGGDGADSVFNVNAEGSGSTMTAIGGGAGGASGGWDGGSGGGNGRGMGTNGDATQGDSGGGTGYGNDGGDATGAGGGGGAGGVGSGGSAGGAGGAGREFSNFSDYGVSGFFAGGGGGGSASGAGAGGSGGGGAGGQEASGTDGTANTGGGGGGGSASGSYGGVGGTGVVLIKHSGAPPRHTITANGDVTQTRAVKKVGDSSIVFDGTGDYLNIPNSTDWQFSGEFTIEGFIRKPAMATVSDLFTIYGGGGGGGNAGFQIFVGNNSAGYGIDCYFSSDGSAWTNVQEDYTWSNDTWYHLAVTRDSSDDVHIWVNGTEVGSGTSFTGTVADPAAYDTLSFGARTDTSANQWEGYMDEIRISNTDRYTSAFTPTTTEFTADANTLLLIHSNWDGGLGADSSGNANDFTPTNLVATDQMKDSPTNNFSTWNPLTKRGYGGGDATLAEGNLKGTTSTSYNGTGSTFILPASGKWYAEFTPVTINSTSGLLFGIADPSSMYTGQKVYDNNTPCAVYRNGGLLIYTGDTSTSTDYSAYVAGDIVGVAIDMDEDEIWFAKNNTWQGSGSPNPSTGTSGHDLSTASGVSYTVIFGSGSTDNEVGIVNFGQDSSFAGTKTAQGNADGNGIGDFYYEPPSGFLALCADNLPDPEIKLPGENFNTLLWTGDGAASRSITGLGFQADMMWSKIRSDTHQHNLVDTVRGVDQKLLMPNLTNAQDTTCAHGWFDSLDSDGWSMTYAGGGWNVNTSSETYVGWAWKGGGSAVTNTDGTNIDSEVSANTTAGFSICKYTSTGTNGDSFGHGLSQAPELVIVKVIGTTDDWIIGSTAGPMDFTYYMRLNSNIARTGPYSAYWDDTAPTSSVVTVGTNGGTNNASPTREYIAYCFHSVEGYSKVGSYEGNGNADGTCVITGFRPSFLLLKNIDSTESWWMIDDKRDTYNPEEHHIRPNENSAEYTGSDIADFVSNGFKFRDSDGAWNGSATYIYLAFAESPFKYANAR